MCNEISAIFPFRKYIDVLRGSFKRIGALR
jgi:hypothetical protein